MDNTYIVYSEEYYLNLNTLSPVLKKKVYNVSYDEESAEEVKNMMSEVLQNNVDIAEINANNEILTTYNIKVIRLSGKLSIETAKKVVIDDDYTWGKVGRPSENGKVYGNGLYRQNYLDIVETKKSSGRQK